LTNNILNRNAVIFVGFEQTVDIVPTPVVRAPLAVVAPPITPTRSRARQIASVCF
jgi:hypothetical protein